MDGRESVLKPLQPGEIFRLYHTNRPIIIVSREELNRGDYVIAVLVTSQHLSERWNLPNCVPFRAGQFGFEKDCVAQGESVTVLEKVEVDLESGPVGRLSDEAMRGLIRAIGNVFSAECEPI